MSQILNAAIAVVGIDIGKNSFHVVGSIGAVLLCCGRSGRVARWKRALPTCHRHGSLRRRASSQP
jgi:hypothetical protein